MSKSSIVVFLILFSSTLFGQKVFPYLNNQDHLKTFHEGISYQLDYLKPLDVQYNENIIAFVDNKRDLFVYDGEKKEKLSGMINDYKIGMDIVAWNAGPIINVWHNGRKQNLTYFGGFYEVSDSLVVFEDTRDHAIRVFYQGEIIELFASIERPYFPSAIGSNSVAFRGNGGVYYAFIAGEIIEIGAFNEHINFAAGGNLVVFNDPFNQSFAVVFPSGILDVEETMVENYQAGYDMFVYRDRSGNLLGFIDGELVTLSSFPSFYEVFRDMVVWGENGTLNTYKNGTTYEIANYIPDDYKIRDGIVAFRNLNGGVSLFRNEIVEVISNQINTSFEVNGNTVRIQIHRGNYDFVKNGYAYPTTRQ